MAVDKTVWTSRLPFKRNGFISLRLNAPHAVFWNTEDCVVTQSSTVFESKISTISPLPLPHGITNECLHTTFPALPKTFSRSSYAFIFACKKDRPDRKALPSAVTVARFNAKINSHPMQFTKALHVTLHGGGVNVTAHRKTGYICRSVLQAKTIVV